VSEKNHQARQPQKKPLTVTAKLFEDYPELQQLSHSCNEYLEVRDLPDVRNLPFLEKVAVVLTLMRYQIREEKIGKPKRAANNER
jgi:hypothetical protein